MIFLDTNIFLIDRFFKEDIRYSANKTFLETLSEIDAGVSIFILLELCGIASFNLSSEELNKWMYRFDKVYNVTVVYPQIPDNLFGITLFNDFIMNLYAELEKKATLVDAILIKEAKAHGVSEIVTWNKRHFEHRSDIKVSTPTGFMKKIVR